jgi:hypothetical protein
VNAADVELWLCQRRGWCLRVPERVPDSALQVMIAYALTMYEKQHKEMAGGDRKRRFERAINDLIKLKVTQIVVKPKEIAC